MRVIPNINGKLRGWVDRKWPTDEGKRDWYEKLANARRLKTLRCSEAQGHRCCYCLRATWHPSYGETGSRGKLATLEHFIPRANGGTDHMHNLVMACYSCNNRRQDDYDAFHFWEVVQQLVVDPKIANRKERAVLRQQQRVEKLAKSLVRQDKAVLITAWTLTQLGLWDWFHLWMDTSETFRLTEQEPMLLSA